MGGKPVRDPKEEVVRERSLCHPCVKEALPTPVTCRGSSFRPPVSSGRELDSLDRTLVSYMYLFEVRKLSRGSSQTRIGPTGRSGPNRSVLLISVPPLNTFRSVVSRRLDPSSPARWTWSTRQFPRPFTPEYWRGTSANPSEPLGR